MPFICSICGEESTRICTRCTKDACDNHLCEKCLRCSDCCECEVSLSQPVRVVVHANTPAAEPTPQQATAAPEPSLPPPDEQPPAPDPEPEALPE